MKEMKVDTLSRNEGNSYIETFREQKVYHFGGVTSDVLSDFYCIFVTVYN